MMSAAADTLTHRRMRDVTAEAATNDEALHTRTSGAAAAGTNNDATAADMTTVAIIQPMRSDAVGEQLTIALGLWRIGGSSRHKTHGRVLHPQASEGLDTRSPVIDAIRRGTRQRNVAKRRTGTANLLLTVPHRHPPQGPRDSTARLSGAKIQPTIPLRRIGVRIQGNL